MPRKNYRKRDIRKRVTRQLDLLAYQLEAFARDLKARRQKPKRRHNRKSLSCTATASSLIKGLV